MTKTQLTLNKLQTISGGGVFAKLGEIKADYRQEQPKRHDFTTEPDVGTARCQTKKIAGVMFTFIPGDMFWRTALKIYGPRHPWANAPQQMTEPKNTEDQELRLNSWIILLVQPK